MNGPDDLDEMNVQTLGDLSQPEWMEIKKIAMELYHRKEFGGDQMKCAIHAFLAWLNSKDLELGHVITEEKRPKNAMVH